MESWLVVVLCSCLAGQALGLPRAADLDPSLSRSSADQRDERIHSDRVFSESTRTQILKRTPAEEDVVEVPVLGIPAEEESKTKMEEKDLSRQEESKKPCSFPGAEMIHRLPIDLKETTEEAEQNVRAKKSASIQDMPHNHGPHTTTVCIQVRSDHQPKVVCGDPLGDSKRDETILPPKARFAYTSANDYFPHTYDQQPLMPLSLQKGYVRAPPPLQNMMPGRPPSKQILPSQLGPNKSPSVIHGQGPIRPKSAAGGPLPVSMYPSRRSEDDPSAPKIGDATLPGAGLPPSRLQPQGLIPHPNSVVVHKQYYPAPPFQQGFYAPPAASPLRLNCATDGSFVPYLRNGPDGYIPYMRSGPPGGFLPMEERLIVNPADPRMAEAPQYIDEQQTYMIDPQARQAFPDSIVGSPYTPDELSGTLFMDDIGQTYIMNDNQARSAVEDHNVWEQDQYLGAERKDDNEAVVRKQEEDLKQANIKLHQLEEQLADISKKTALDKVEKDTTKERVKEPEPNSTSDIPAKATDKLKTPKRHIYRRK